MDAVIFVLFLVAAAGGAYWKRAELKAWWAARKD